MYYLIKKIPRQGATRYQAFFRAIRSLYRKNADPRSLKHPVYISQVIEVAIYAKKLHGTISDRNTGHLNATPQTPRRRQCHLVSES